jgi:hypothetical protein
MSQRQNGRRVRDRPDNVNGRLLLKLQPRCLILPFRLWNRSDKVVFFLDQRGRNDPKQRRDALDVTDA